MNKLLVIILATLAMGCGGNSLARQGEVVGTDRERLVEIAKRELTRRNLILPNEYSVIVENGKILSEVNDLPREVYGVWFSFTYRGKRGAYYSVLIDKHSKKIDQVSDLRNVKLHAF